MKCQGRKSAKTTIHLMLCDNPYHILAISNKILGERHDSFNLYDNFTQLFKTLDQSEVDELVFAL